MAAFDKPRSRRCGGSEVQADKITCADASLPASSALVHLFIQHDFHVVVLCAPRFHIAPAVDGRLVEAHGALVLLPSRVHTVTFSSQRS